MPTQYIEEKTFTKIDFTQNPIQKGEYESCIFNGCNFSNTDLSRIIFTECTFENCNLSMATLCDTTFMDTTFKQCKMLGLHFEDCNDIGMLIHFEDCSLDHSSFYKKKIQKCQFTNIKFHEVDFTDCDCSGIIFKACDFSGAIFQNTILKKADLRTSFNYTIDPENNQIKQAKFSILGIPGLLNKYDIVVDHTMD